MSYVNKGVNLDASQFPIRIVQLLSQKQSQPVRTMNVISELFQIARQVFFKTVDSYLAEGDNQQNAREGDHQASDHGKQGENYKSIAN